MQVKKLAIKGLTAIYPEQSTDENGRYSYFFDREQFKELGVLSEFVQEHASCYAMKWTVRGLHFQAPPKDQFKLVRVTKGRILDFCVDIRTNSPSYGAHESIELSADSWIQLLVPPGIAHGFKALENQTMMIYKTSTAYFPANDAGIAWNSFGFEWGVDVPTVSKRDQEHTSFVQFNTPF